MPELPVLGVSDFVAILNQTLELTMPIVEIVGELSNFQVRKNQWVYFDLKDEESSVRFFGTVYNLPGPLEDGLMLQVRARPRMHPRFGFSLQFDHIQPVGEGSFKKAAALLEAKLRKEGLFDDARKRPLPYPPRRIGLVASGESAAYADFIKIMNSRWGRIEVVHVSTLVQGSDAPRELRAAIAQLNEVSETLEVIVITRGGGSADDLAAFNDETVVRAVAASRVPTLVAIGHEIDISLAELAADRRASTPSNAAELLVPDRKHEQMRLNQHRQQLARSLQSVLQQLKHNIVKQSEHLEHAMLTFTQQKHESLNAKKVLLSALSPRAVLKRGYAIVRSNGKVVRSSTALKSRSEIQTELGKGGFSAIVKEVGLQ